MWGIQIGSSFKTKHLTFSPVGAWLPRRPAYLQPPLAEAPMLWEQSFPRSHRGSEHSEAWWSQDQKALGCHKAEPAAAMLSSLLQEQSWKQCGWWLQQLLGHRGSYLPT